MAPHQRTLNLGRTIPNSISIERRTHGPHDPHDETEVDSDLVSSQVLELIGSINKHLRAIKEAPETIDGHFTCIVCLEQVNKESPARGFGKGCTHYINCHICHKCYLDMHEKGVNSNCPMCRSPIHPPAVQRQMIEKEFRSGNINQMSLNERLDIQSKYDEIFNDLISRFDRISKQFTTT